MSIQSDVLVIGAGPAGAVAAKLLIDKGFSVTIIERSIFPRFSIGESLLPQCMEFLDKAGLVEVINRAGFQLKNGAVFQSNEDQSIFDFTQKFTAGPGTTFQVKRAQFDKILADCVEAAGAKIHYGESIVSVDVSGKDKCIISHKNSGEQQKYYAKFILDASGFGRVLPRLLDLEKPSSFPPRQSLFTHIIDHIDASEFDRDKILISVHPKYKDVWYWLIPFSDGTSSIGVVATEGFLEKYKTLSLDAQLVEIVHQEPGLKHILARAQWHQKVNKISGYSVSIKRLYGPGYALLGNAGEFLDPIFSSGVTIALQSSVLAVDVLERQLNGEQVNWEKDYSQPLYQGINVFKAFVEAWYNHQLQDIIFSKVQPDDIKQKICSILAGYAWDTKNTYNVASKRKLSVLASVCQKLSSQILPS